MTWLFKEVMSGRMHRSVINPEVNKDVTGDAIVKWFKNRGHNYRYACSAGVAKPSNVKTRLEEVRRVFEEIEYAVR